MQVETTSTADGSLLRAVRTTLAEADEAILCVAFASEQGVHLLGKELAKLGPHARVLVTTAFGSTTPGALQRAHEHRLDVRVCNPAGGRTYHPKLYIGRSHDGAASAVIGSVNLTGGLVNNVEIGTWLRGRVDDEPIARAWAWAQDRWANPRTVRWTPVAGMPAAAAVMPAELMQALQEQVASNNEFRTLGGRPQVNVVTDVRPDGLYVRTERSTRLGPSAPLVPAWMFELAWSYLVTHGELTNTTLLNELRVHRSSAVCAILARLPDVEVVAGREIRLRWRGREDSGLG